MKKQKKLIKSVVSVLIFVTVFLLMATVCFAMDYSKPGVANKETLDSADILTEIFEVKLTELEREYLAICSEYEIIYTSSVPSNLVEIKHNESEGVFSVTAKPYLYTATNAKTVQFIPFSVKVRDNDSILFEKQGEKYVAAIEDDAYGEEDSATVTYKTYVEVDFDIANYLIGKTYGDAVIFSEYEEESASYKSYLAELAVYEEYVINKALYDRDANLYFEYLDEKERYENDLVDYNEYLVALEEYNENYLAYTKDRYVIENYTELYQKYQTYSSQIATVREQLNIIDGLKRETFDRSVYNAVIIGTTVTSVLTNKELIANEVVGASKADVENAGLATDNLRSLCKPYFNLTGELEKYSYYKLYYEEIRDNFTTLWVSLDNLYKNAKIRTVIADMGMRDKYEILLGQLCYVTMALNGGPVGDYSPDYVINARAGVTVLSVLGGVPYMSYGNDPTPIDSYPVEQKEPVIQNIPEPTRPKEVKCPIEPEEVFMPSSEPIPVDKPNPVEDPGEPPKNYEKEDIRNKLISAYRAGELVMREPIFDVGLFEIEAVLSKNLLGSTKEYTVTFYDENGNFLYTTKVDEGSYVDYDGELPTKAETPGSKYTFVGWKDKDGNERDVTSVTEPLELYPIFQESIKSYEIRWTVDGKTAYTNVQYGEIPICPLEIFKSDSENFEYIFSGWNTPITAVSCNASYVAIFSSSPLYANGSVSRDENGFFVQQSSAESSYRLDNLISRVKKNESITINSANCTVELFPETLSAMKECGYTGVSLSVVRLQTDGGYKITVNMLDSDGKPVDSSVNREKAIKVNVKRNVSFDENDIVTFFYREGDERVIVRSSYVAGVLSASYEVGRTYYAVVDYPAYVFPDENLSISVKSDEQKTSSAQKGELVTVLISDIADGIVVDGVYYVDINNGRFEIEKDSDGAYRFVMKEGGVTVGVDSHIRTYKVSFVVDGVIFGQQLISHGDFAPMLSAAKKSDGNYSYDFCGWSVSENFGVVELGKMPITSDVTFYAVFTPVKIVRPPVDQWRNPAKIFLVVFYGAIVLVPVIFMVAFKLVRRSRRRI